MNPWLMAAALIAAAAFVALAWGVLEAAWKARADEETVQPLVAARPDIAPRCEAAHCGCPAYVTALHVDGDRIWVCAGDRDRGYREGWLVREAAAS